MKASCLRWTGKEEKNNPDELAASKASGGEGRICFLKKVKKQ